jgi:hypothetical protein
MEKRSRIADPYLLCRLTLLLTLLLIAGPVTHAQAPPIYPSVPESVVRDRFLAYLFSIVRYNRTMTITGADFLALFPEFAEEPDSPVHYLTEMTRRRAGVGTILLLRFQASVDYPAPIDILGTRPVHVKFSSYLQFTEETYSPGPNLDFHSNTQREALVDMAYVFRIAAGYFRVDFASWLDFLLGSIVDDVDVDVVVIARFQQQWYGLMAGTSPNGRLVTGVFDLRRSRFLARPPRELTDFVIDRLATQ